MRNLSCNVLRFITFLSFLSTPVKSLSARLPPFPSATLQHRLIRSPQLTQSFFTCFFYSSLLCPSWFSFPQSLPPSAAVIDPDAFPSLLFMVNDNLLRGKHALCRTLLSLAPFSLNTNSGGFMFSDRRSFCAGPTALFTVPPLLRSSRFLEPSVCPPSAPFLPPRLG